MPYYLTLFDIFEKSHLAVLSKKSFANDKK